MKNAYSLFLSPRGRIGRLEFMIGVAVLIGFSISQKYIFSIMGDGLTSFFLPMIFFFLTLHIILCIFGKRLHDLGRSLWPLMGLFSLIIITSILISQNYGGLEFLDTVIAHPEYAQDEVAMKKELQVYQDTLAAEIPKVRWLMAILPGVFTAWLLLRPGMVVDNKYGLAQNTNK